MPKIACLKKTLPDIKSGPGPLIRFFKVIDTKGKVKDMVCLCPACVKREGVMSHALPAEAWGGCALSFADGRAYGPVGDYYMLLGKKTSEAMMALRHEELSAE